jgi:alanine dehydrogenase
MIVGVPKEIKANENRVALQPSGVEMLRQNGHTVLIETKAGVGSGFEDEDYKQAGAQILATPKEIFEKADMIMKVKEPLAKEHGLIREGQILFTYFHFAASKELTEAIMKTKSVAIAYETIEKADGSLPMPGKNFWRTRCLVGRRDWRGAGKSRDHWRRHRRNECCPDGGWSWCQCRYSGY